MDTSIVIIVADKRMMGQGFLNRLGLLGLKFLVIVVFLSSICGKKSIFQDLCTMYDSIIYNII